MLPSLRKDSVIKISKLFALLILPTLLFCIVLQLKEARGPYHYNFNDDPEYAYLLNALNLTQGIPPHHVDHPGTPLQTWSALVIKGVHHFNASDAHPGLVQSVLHRPEYYLNAIQLSLSLTFCALLYVIGLRVYRFKQSLGIALLIQSSPLWFYTIPVSMARIHAESLLLIIGYGLCAMLLSPLTQRKESKDTGRGLSIGLGFIVACGIMTKVTFAPILPLVFLLIHGKVARTAFLLSSLLAMGLWAIPLIPRFDYYISWIVGLAIHTEAYGKGDIGLIDIENFGFISKIILNEPVYSLLLACSLAIVAKQLISSITAKRTIGKAIQTLMQPLVLLCCFQVGFFIFILKQPNIHYLTPALPILALTVVGYLQDAQSYFSHMHRAASLLAIAIIGLSTIILGVRYQLGIAEAQAIHSHSVAAEAFAHEQPEGFIIANAYGSSSKTFALIFGDIFAGSHYESQIKEIYSDHLWFSVWASRFYIERNRVRLTELTATSDAIIVRGSNMRPPSDGLPGTEGAIPFTLYKEFGNESFWIHPPRSQAD